MNIAICYDETLIQKQLDNMGGRRGIPGRLDTYTTAGELLASKKAYDLVLIDGGTLQDMQRYSVPANKPRQKSDAVLTIHTRQQRYAVRKADILYAENDLKKIILHTTTDIIEYTMTMRELEEQLGDGFYRCHRGFLVNLAHISEYGGDTIIVDNGDEIYLARRKYAEFAARYNAYLKG